MVIAVEQLSFRYPGSAEPTLHELGFEIATGEIFGFLGPSGAGKSTTQNILTKLLGGYQGSVRVFDRALASWGSEYYERIGVAFEMPTHFRKLTARENLQAFGALYQHPTLNPQIVLDQVGLGDSGDLRVEQFSKGMMNRLSVARALLHQPELLFLDEPTSGLDPVNSQRIKELIQVQRNAGATIVLTTHNMAIADELCDRVAFMIDGRIALIDSPRTLKLRYGQASVLVEYRTGTELSSAVFPLAGLGTNRNFLELANCDRIQTMHSQEAALDDIFVQVAGRNLA